MKILISQAFFPHYRAAIFQTLARDNENTYSFCGSTVNKKGVEPLETDSLCRFQEIRGFRLGPLFFQPQLVWVVTSGRYDVFIFNGDAQHITTWIAAAIARIRSKRVLFWTHGWTRPEKGLKALVRRTFYSLANALLLYGNRACTFATRAGFHESDLYVVHNSLDFEEQRSLRESTSDATLSSMRAQLFPNSSNPIVICSSRLSRRRRLDLLLDAVALLRDEGHFLNVLLVGEGPERTALERQAESLGIDVYFAGACYDEGLLSRYTMIAAVTVAPGQVGLTAIQSLAYGVPVITHGDFDRQMPEAESIQSGLTGEFFEYDDVSDLARTIKKWTQSCTPTSAVREACINRIATVYTPANQARVINAAANGHDPATVRLH